MEKITNYNDGTYISSIKLLDSVIVFDLIDNHGQDVFILNLHDYDLTKLTKEMYSIEPLRANYYDEQDPNNYKDGMIYSRDKSGIFNL